MASEHRKTTSDETDPEDPDRSESDGLEATVSSPIDTASGPPAPRVVARVGEVRTVGTMPADYSIKARSDALINGVRAGAARSSSASVAVASRPLSTVLRRPTRSEALAHKPTTRTVDATGRLKLHMAGRSIADLLGWTPGLLESHVVGDWIRLRPSLRSVPARRYGSNSRLFADGRLRLHPAARTHLDVVDGGEVMVLVRPDLDALFLCDPALILIGASLDQNERVAS